MLQAESDRNQAHADLESAEQSLRILGIPKPESTEQATPLSEIPLLAPIGGEVVERLVSPGQVLQAGATQAFTISDMSTVWVLANVFQSDLASVKVGDAVTVQTDAYPGYSSAERFLTSPRRLIRIRARCRRASWWKIPGKN